MPWATTNGEMMRREVQVAIVGGGPAGASAALELVRRGVDAMVLERSDGTGNPVGECLAPTINPLLHRLGIDRALPRSRALPSHGNRSSWGGDGAAMERDFLREPYGHGWHLDRPAFNVTLLESVAAAGVPVWRQARVGSLNRTPAGWTIGVDLPGEAQTVTAESLIDASGRAAVVARQLGVRRRRFDSQVAVATVLEQAAGVTPPHDATTLIEAAETGWWYAALLPDGRLAATFFTDPDLLARSGVWRPAAWWRLLRASDLLWDCVSRNGYEIPERIQTLPTGSWLLAELAGEGWIATGDAAAAYDPLSSHGIGSALAGGEQAAAALAATIQGDTAALPSYAARLRTGYAKYLWLRHAYYADERRWPNAPFWTRRQGETRESIDMKLASISNRPPRAMLGGRSRH
jgi:flavin-dependent dehydrogenase